MLIIVVLLHGLRHLHLLLLIGWLSCLKITSRIDVVGNIISNLLVLLIILLNLRCLSPFLYHPACELMPPFIVCLHRVVTLRRQRLEKAINILLLLKTLLLVHHMHRFFLFTAGLL